MATEVQRILMKIPPAGVLAVVTPAGVYASHGLDAEVHFEVIAGGEAFLTPRRALFHLFPFHCEC